MTVTWFFSAYRDCDCSDLREARGLIPTFCPDHPGSHVAGLEVGVELDDPDPVHLGHRCEGGEA